jgi:dienelactone hydrolase
MGIVDKNQKGLTRRNFVKRTAAMAAGGAVVGMAGTSLPASGREQNPPQPARKGPSEAMSAEIVTIRGHKGDTIDAYLARPSGTGRYPGVVVIHHMPGWDEATKEITRKFAHHGYVAISPNLHFREGKGSPEENSASVRAAGGMPDDRTMGDVEGGIRHLRTLAFLNGKVGIIGYCSGGRQVYLAACTLNGIDAAVDCYGGGVVATCGADRLYERPPLSIAWSVRERGQASVTRGCSENGGGTQEVGENVRVPHVRQCSPRFLWSGSSRLSGGGCG